MLQPRYPVQLHIFPWFSLAYLTNVLPEGREDKRTPDSEEYTDIELNSVRNATWVPNVVEMFEQMVNSETGLDPDVYRFLGWSVCFIVGPDT